MSRTTQGDDRDQLLADVSEMYYEEGMTQQHIAHSVGVTRSAISRMLSEARRKGIIEIHIRRPLRFDRALEAALARRFGLQSAHVVSWRREDYDGLRRYLGLAASRVLRDMLTPSTTLGLTWGTTVTATVDALEGMNARVGKVVQLVGALGARAVSYDARALVHRLADGLGGEAVYLSAPFVVESAELAHCLKENASIQEALEIGRHCDIVLVGVGSSMPDYSSLYLGGHITLKELDELREAGAVGDACGLHYGIDGEPLASEFHERLVGISREDLLSVPIRVGIGGGRAKVEALLGALRGGYMNILITNSLTATEILQLDSARNGNYAPAATGQRKGGNN
ncbi:MAG TPA: sugar-binding domain-containing protein [Aggregatilineales bacterium]|jgi:DNA-binding transcriptional regulator LsrR (DeoR family)|nr:sugar-binding domain-containing protein [Aggregatilineales bacterium]